MPKPKILSDISKLRSDLQIFKEQQLAGRYYIPTYSISSHLVSNTIINANPIPTSGWKESTPGVRYTNEDYIITASSYTGTNSVDKAFNSSQSEQWTSIPSMNSWVQVEFPKPVGIKALNMYCLVRERTRLSIRGSNDTNIWYTIYTATLENEYRKISPTFENPTAYKYYQVLYESLGEVDSVSLIYFLINSYLESEYTNSYSLDDLEPSSFIPNQRLMIKTPNHGVMDFSANTLNNIPINEILSPNTYYELLYTGTSFEVMSSSSDLDETISKMQEQVTQSLYILQQNIDDVYTYLGGLMNYVSVGNLPIGTEVYIYESGVLTPFIIVHKNSTGHPILMRKYLLPSTYYNLSSDFAHYGDNTEVNNYLVGTYQSTLSIAYAPVNIEVGLRASNSEVTVSRAVFLPSLMELTGSGYDSDNNYTYSRLEGTQFDYFKSNPSLIATYNGDPKGWHLRTICNSNNNYYVHATGEVVNSSFSTLWHLRPCISVLSTAYVYVKLATTATNVLATAEIIE